MGLISIQAALAGGSIGTSGGVTDNSPILASLISGGSKGGVFEPGTYLFNSPVTLPADFILVGSGRGVTKLIFAGTGALFTCGNRVTIQSLTIDGTDYTADRKGIYWNDKNRISIIDVEFTSIKWGVFFENNVTTYEASLIDGCYGNSCGTVYHSDIRGEYVTINNSNAYNSLKGAYIAGGNTKVVGGNFTGNNYGIHLVSGTNHAHSLIDGVTCNHNGMYGLFVDAVTLGMNIVNCSFQSAAVLIQNSQNILFNNNMVDANIVLDNASSCQVRNNNTLSGATVSQINGSTGNDVGNN